MIVVYSIKSKTAKKLQWKDAPPPYHYNYSQPMKHSRLTQENK